MGQALNLEAFDDAAAGDVANNVNGKGYDDGYQAGRADAAANEAALNAELVQALADASFTYAEAKGEVLRSLAPLLTTIVNKVLPYCITAGFTDQIAGMLQDSAATQMAPAASLTVHPSQVDVIARTLATTDLGVTCAADPALTPHAVWLRCGTAEHLFDPDQLMAEIAAIFAALEPAETQRSSDG